MKIRRSRLITLTLAVLIASFTVFAGSQTTADQERRYRLFFIQSAQALVPGFRLPDESQYGPIWAFVEGFGWQTRDGSGETKAEFWTSGEFNGDETTDYAYILVEEATDTRVLFAFVSTTEGYEAKQLDSGFAWGIWLRTRVPGRYETVAGPRAGRNSPRTVLEFENENQAIDFFQFAGSASSFVWNATTQSFDRFWTQE